MHFSLEIGEALFFFGFLAPNNWTELEVGLED